MKKSVFSWMPAVIACFGSLLCFFAFMPLGFATPDAGRTIYHSHRRLVTNAHLNYFQSEANYTKSGNVFEGLPNGQSFKNYLVDLNGTYGLKPGWSIYGGSHVSSSESQSASATRTNSAFSDVYLGTNFMAFKSNPMMLIPDFYFLQPLVKNDVTSDNVSINDGAMEIGGKLQIQWLLENYHFGGFIGYTYRDQGLSNLLPYGAYFEYPMSGIEFGVNLVGFSSVSSDKDSNNEVNRTLFTNRANAGSYKFYSVNPSLLQTNLWLKFQSSPSFAFEFGGGSTLNGTSAASGWNVMVGVQWSTQMKPQSIRVRQEEVEKFQEQTNDGVNQELFSPPPPENQQEQEDQTAETLDTFNKQQELNKTEMKIQMKSDKKKRKKKDR